MEQTREQVRKNLTNLIINEGQKSEEKLVPNKDFEKGYTLNKEIHRIKIDLFYAFNEGEESDSVLGLGMMNPNNPKRLIRFAYMEINFNGKIRYQFNNGAWGLFVPKEFKGNPEELFLRFGGYILNFIKDPEGFQN